MDLKKTGFFIAELRKQQNLTQKDLAEKLDITDKAVSRWETGRGFPDVSLLPPLAEVLQISVSEIVLGKKLEKGSEIMEKTVITTLHHSQKQKEKILRLCALIVSLSCFGTIAIGVIVNFAVEAALTWSLYMVLSIVFAWAIAATALSQRKNRLPAALLVASVLLIPYLYLLEALTGAVWFLALGLPIAGLVIIALWIEYFIATKLTLRWQYLTALELFLNGVVYVPIVVALSLNFTGVPLGLYIYIAPIIGAVLAAVFFAIGFAQKTL